MSFFSEQPGCGGVSQQNVNKNTWLRIVLLIDTILLLLTTNT